MADISVEVRGIEEVSQKMQQVVRDLQGREFEQAMANVTLIVTRAAKINAPWDTGRLRASIAPEVQRLGGNVVGITGSPVEYAARIEAPGRVRFGGRRPYLEPALTENESRIVAEIGDFVARIVEK